MVASRHGDRKIVFREGSRLISSSLSKERIDVEITL